MIAFTIGPLLSVGESIYFHYMIRFVLAVGLLGLLLILSDAVLTIKKRRDVGDLPFILQECFFGPWLEWTRKERDFDNEMGNAYRKYTKNGKAFAIPNLNASGSFIILPPQTCNEWVNLPNEKLSWTSLMTGEFLLGDVNFNMNWKISSQAILACNRNLVMNQVEGHIVKEVGRFLNQTFGSTNQNDWKSIRVVDMVIELASSVALKLVLNPEFGKDPKLLEHMMTYSESLEGRVSAQNQYPFLLRPFVRQFSHSTRTLKSSIAALKKILKPEIRLRMERILEKGEGTSTGSEIFYTDSMIHFSYKNGLLNPQSGEKEKDKLADLISEHSLIICFEFLGPVWMFAAIMLFQIMSNPEYVPILRDELESALENTNGEWTFDMFKQTPKLESFTRETLRCNPPSTLTSGRLVMKPLYLPSMGKTLKQGTAIALPSRWVLMDPEIYPDPETFNGLRFIDPITGACDVRNTTTPTQTWLPFAIGSLTCPARLAGIRVCQVILSKMILEYDMRLVNRVNSPLMLHSVGVAFPNPEIEMQVKGRWTNTEKAGAPQ